MITVFITNKKTSSILLKVAFCDDTRRGSALDQMKMLLYAI